MGKALRGGLLWSLLLGVGAQACASEESKVRRPGNDDGSGNSGGAAPANAGGASEGDGKNGDLDGMNNAGTEGGNPTKPVVPADIALPAYPFFDNDAIDPDDDVLAEQGGRWCASKPEDASNAAFFYGWMPLDTVDMLCAPRAPDLPAIEKLMGNMYLSGFFGGIWFRDNAQSGGVARPAGTGQGGTSETDFQSLATKIRARIDLSLKGKDADVLAHVLSATATDLTKALESTPLIYAYNKGYAVGSQQRASERQERSAVHLFRVSRLSDPGRAASDFRAVSPVAEEAQGQRQQLSCAAARRAPNRYARVSLGRDAGPGGQQQNLGECGRRPVVRR